MSVTSILPFEFGAPRNLSSKRGAELLATMIVEYCGIMAQTPPLAA